MLISNKIEVLTSDKPSPFNYSTAGEYLKSAYRYKKVIEPGLSHRYLALKMGYRSSAAFQDLIKGRVIPNEIALKAIKTEFDLNENEAYYLALLFIVQSINDPFYKNIMLEYVRNSLNIK